MKRRKFAIGALLILSLGFFFAARSAASWRPQVIGEAPGAYDLSFSPDGRWLLAMLRTSDESPMVAFDLNTRVENREFDATFAEFSRDSKKLIVVDRPNSELRIVDLQSGKIQQRWKALTLQPFEGIDDVQLQKNGREIVVATQYRIWRLDVQSGKKLSQTKLQIQVHENPHGYNGAFLLKDEKRLLYMDGDEGYILDAHSGKRLSKAEFGLLSSDEKWLWFYNPEVGQFWIEEFATGKNSWGREFYDEPKFSGDGRSLIVMDAKTGVRLLDPKTGDFIRKLAVATPHEDDLFNPAYAISPDNDYWFVRQGDKILRYRLR